MAQLGNVGFFVSTWIQWIFLALALGYGVVGVVQLVRRTRSYRS
jgi:hypothetical protein